VDPKGRRMIRRMRTRGAKGRTRKWFVGVGAAFAAAIALAAPAPADVDTDFAAQLRTYGIYGQRDFNAWMAKITCQRLSSGLDPDAEASVRFLSHNLARSTTSVQHWQFLGAAITYYCPELTSVWQNAAMQHN
jgi:hypothetical protein